MLQQMRKRKFWENYYFLYTAAFAVVSSLVFITFYLHGRSFICYTDGLPQIFRGQLFYAKYLKGILKTFLTEGKLMFPTYSFNLGYGMDILGTLSYYVVGDPIAALAVLVPAKWMAYYYSFAVLLRLYLAGITFSLYCHYRRKVQNPTGGGTVILQF